MIASEMRSLCRIKMLLKIASMRARSLGFRERLKQLTIAASFDELDVERDGCNSSIMEVP